MEDITNPPSANTGVTVTGLQSQTGVADNTDTDGQNSTQSPESKRLVELEQQAADYQQKLAHAEQVSRQLQSQRDQAIQRTQALAGITPQVDPILDKASKYASQVGLAAEDVKSVLTILQGELSPYMDAMRQQQATMQASAQVSNALQAAYTQNPQLFSDPANAKAAQDALQEAAFRNPEYVTPEYAMAIAKQQWADNYWSNQQAGKQNVPAHIPQAPQFSGNIPSFMGPPGGFTPVAQPNQRPANPLSAQFDKDIAARYGTK